MNNFEYFLDKLHETPSDQLLQLYVGLSYATGCGTKQDLKLAVEHINTAYQLGNQRAKSLFAMIVSESLEDLSTDELAKKAVDYHKQLAEEEHFLPSILFLGRLYASGNASLEVEQDLIHSFHFYQKAAELGDLRSMQYLVQVLLSEDDIEAHEAILSLLEDQGKDPLSFLLDLLREAFHTFNDQKSGNILAAILDRGIQLTYIQLNPTPETQDEANEVIVKLR